MLMLCLVSKRRLSTLHEKFMDKTQKLYTQGHFHSKLLLRFYLKESPIDSTQTQFNFNFKRIPQFVWTFDCLAQGLLKDLQKGVANTTREIKDVNYPGRGRDI